MRPLVKAGLLLALGFLPAVCVGAGQGGLPCFSAAFSRKRDLAKVMTAGNTLGLHIIRSGGTRQSGRATIRTDRYGEAECPVFISDDGSLAAVVTRLTSDVDPETVRLWDVEKGEWLSSFRFAPRPGLEGGITFLGFWKGGHDLVVESATGARRSVTALALVDGSGRVVEGPAQVEFPLVDAEDGLVWASRPGAGSYDVFAFDFANPPGKLVASANLPSDCYGMSTQTVGFPGPDMLVGARNSGSTQITVVSSCNVNTGSHSQISIPPPRRQFLDRNVDSGPAVLAVSPDGKFFGVAVEATRWSHFDTERAEWDDLYIFQTAPLREIGKIGPEKGCRDKHLGGFAVGDAGDVPRVAANWCGKWSVQTLNIPPPAPDR